jgi:hypothetical protein
VYDVLKNGAAEVFVVQMQIVETDADCKGAALADVLRHIKS